MSEPLPSPPRSRVRRGVEVALSFAALVCTVLVVGAGPLWARLREIDLGWLAVGLAITVVQYALFGARWWFVAARLGVPLSYGRAISEYYLSSLLNYVLPFGMFGVALRAVRHAEGFVQEKERPPVTRVVMAIVLERASGHLALFAVALAAAPDLWRAVAVTVNPHPAATGAVLAALVIVVLALAAWTLRKGRLEHLREIVRAGGGVLFRPSNLVVHLPLSLLIIAASVAVFMVAARSIGQTLALGPAFRIVPPVLVASGLPTLFGGFGAREAAAAGLYHLTGLSAADGATISFVYGSVSLLASLPGIFALPWRGRRPTR
jgi:uncharacterized membrane protein YbhN (UPF0104 family)